MTTNQAPVDSVLLIGFGGPTQPEEIMPFLRKVVEGRGIPDDRLREVEEHYLAVGGRSPYNELTEKQRAGVERWLKNAGAPLPTYLGMRNWHPLLTDTVRVMHADGCRHAAGVILAPHRSAASWDRYRGDVQTAIEANDGQGPAVTYLEPWFDDPRFLLAGAERLAKAGNVSEEAWPEDLPVVFTAHSIPVAMAEDSSYVAEIQASCRGVADLVGVPDWELAYQSRSGSPRIPWLEPDVNDVLRRLAAEGTVEVVVQAIGFLCDHVEVLYDLDVEARQTATDHGLKLRRAGCVNDHPAFIAMLGERVRETVERTTP
jgi:ferrochelatase